MALPIAVQAEHHAGRAPRSRPTPASRHDWGVKETATELPWSRHELAEVQVARPRLLGVLSGGITPNVLEEEISERCERRLSALALLRARSGAPVTT